MENKKIIWMESYQEEDGRSYEEILKDKIKIATLWLVDEDQDLSEIWGDDWNDAPHHCNAGSPYEDKCKGLIKRDLFLGERIKW